MIKSQQPPSDPLSAGPVTPIDKTVGFLLINKPPGITSHDVVHRLRRITDIKRIGHAGTLDPFATGLLIVGVGREATKHLDNFLKLPKRYRATLQLGATSTTGDRTGVITNKRHPDPAFREGRDELGEGSRYDKERKILHFVQNDDAGKNISSIKTVLNNFLGPQEQVPPMYSAKKVGGKKLYTLARKGKTIDRLPVPITITSLELVQYSWPMLIIDVACSSGTYIRTLSEDIGSALGVGAYCQELQRTAIGRFELSRATTLDELTATNWLDHLQGLDLLGEI